MSVGWKKQWSPNHCMVGESTNQTMVDTLVDWATDELIVYCVLDRVFH